MQHNLTKLICKSKDKCNESMLQLIYQFMPLINKYARKLNYEDAKNDLIEHFIITIKKMPPMIEAKSIKYIETSIRNQSIVLSKKQQQYENKIILTDSIETEFTDKEIQYSSLDIKIILDGLNQKTKEILIARYIYGYTDEEIAKKYNISRQAVHKSRKKALLQLKENLSERK